MDLDDCSNDLSVRDVNSDHEPNNQSYHATSRQCSDDPTIRATKVPQTERSELPRYLQSEIQSYHSKFTHAAFASFIATHDGMQSSNHQNKIIAFLLFRNQRGGMFSSEKLRHA